MRYFRCPAAAYDVICMQFDAAYGYPNSQTQTVRALPERSALLNDSEGMVYLPVPTDYCDYIFPSQALPSLISGGVIEELSESEYMAQARLMYPNPPSFS